MGDALITLTLPMPPTANSAFTNMRGSNGKRRVLTDEARAYKSTVHVLARTAARKQGWVYANERLELSLVLHFRNNQRRDIANCEKLLTDALAEVLGFDDCAIDYLHIIRADTDTGNPRCEVALKKL